MLADDVDSYLAVRRSMGFELQCSGSLLRSFAVFSEAAGNQHICAQTAIEWSGSAPSVRTRARRLALIACLAQYLRAEDERHELPPAVFGRDDRKQRPTPYIFSREDVRRLVEAAVKLGRNNGKYRGFTYGTFFALLACTGMRLSEAINLRFQDITPDGLVIRFTKFRKSRLIPLHPTTNAALELYLCKRRSFAPLDDHVFVSLRKRKLLRHDAHLAFREAIAKLAIPHNTKLPHPTIHSLRHTFAVRALETCPDGRDRITRHMVALSTYLGHSKLADTYWYLEATPELLRNVGECSESYFTGGQL
jgi:integrase